MNELKPRQHRHFESTLQHSQSCTERPGGLQSNANLKPTVRGIGEINRRPRTVPTCSSVGQSLAFGLRTRAPAELLVWHSELRTRSRTSGARDIYTGSQGDPVDHLRKSCNQYLPYVSPVASGSRGSLEILLASLFFVLCSLFLLLFSFFLILICLLIWCFEFSLYLS